MAQGISYRSWLSTNNGGSAKKLTIQEAHELIKHLAEITYLKEPIYFADSVHPQHKTQLVYGWILKGERKGIAITGRQYRLNFIGGICLNGHHFIYQQADKVDADSMAAFLGELRRKNPEKHKIYLIQDRAGYHRDKDIQEFAKNLAIELHYLPPYSPNLNPIERLWKIMHERVTYNRYYATSTCCIRHCSHLDVQRAYTR